MRIAIDARELCGNPTGVGRYLRELISVWSTLQTEKHQFILCAHESIQLPSHLISKSFEVRVSAGSGLWWEQYKLPKMVKEARADVLFAPGYSGPLISPVPVVLAVHDVSFAAHPEWFSLREGLRRRLTTRVSAQAASRVLTLSEFSKKEIVDHLGIPPEKIEIIYPGVTKLTKNSQNLNQLAPDPTILFVGSILNRRHVPELIAGFANLANHWPAARLVVVGENRTCPYIDMDWCRKKTNISNRIEIHSYVSENTLRDLYSQAQVFAFLSEYEGFGLTPAEALASEIPIVILDTPVAREIYAQAAIYVSKLDTFLIGKALKQAIEDKKERLRVITTAHTVLQRYSWTRCANRVLEVMREIGQSSEGK